MRYVLQSRRSPCRDCAERMPGCHERCEKYSAYRADREKLYEYRKTKMCNRSSQT